MKHKDDFHGKVLPLWKEEKEENTADLRPKRSRLIPDTDGEQFFTLVVVLIGLLLAVASMIIYG